MFIDILKEALLDTLKTVPFLFLAYLLMEWLEHRAEEKSVETVGRAGGWAPVAGGLIGMVPQCGFSAAVSNLYASGIVTRGTLLAVFLSTSDEMLPILISRKAELGLILKILGYKCAVGILVGLLIDFIGRRLAKENKKSIESICEQEGCKCEDGVLKSALFHTLKITLFLFVTALIVGFAVKAVGTENLEHFILNKPFLGEVLAGLVGLIPNCAASVVLTDLFLKGGMSFGAMMSGLLTASGVGLLVLFRMNRNLKENLFTLLLLYAGGLIFGCLAGMIF
ncbi:MAG: arsenic efflux protein [Lachnospiraceae bacterium]|nr:arsenic efflux protein [Lachnospiraceae bacterium]